MRMHTPSTVSSFCRLLLTNTIKPNTIKLKSKPVRSLVLLGLIAVATTALASTVASSGSLRQLIAGLGLSHAGGSVSQPSQPSAALTNPLLTAPMPQSSSAMTVAMAVERRRHTATLLGDGRVLIVGGENSGGLISQSEIFDPTAGTFSVSGNLNSPRADHSATRLADGRVLVAGGRGTAGALDTTEIFDPTTGAFASGPAMGVARAGHSATLFADGSVFIAGGDESGSAEIFDPSSSAFSAVAANMTTARSMHSAALLQDGRVLIVGGRDAGGNELSSGEIFDGSNFTDAGSMQDTHVRAALRVLPDGKVQIIGGTADHNAIEIYDPAAGIFGAHAHDIDPLNDQHAGLIAELMKSSSRAALLHNGQTITELPGLNKALGAGGVDSNGNATNVATIYDSSSASVTTDVLDYAPGTPVIITGRGFQPNEVVDLTFHEDPHTHAENVRTVQADASGNFTYDQYAPEEHDLGVAFILGAKGQSSGWTAQTTFTDGNTSFTGTVTDSVTSLPISGASVTASCPTCSAGSTSVTVLTNASGVYSTGNLNFAGGGSVSVTVSVTAAGYTSASVGPASYANTSNNTINFSLVPSCTAPSVTTNPINQTVTYGAASASFTAAASGSPAPTVQWQVSTGGPFTDLANVAPYSGVTTGTLLITSPTVSLSGNQYRAVFTNTCVPATATSTAATLTVNPKALTITASDKTKTYGDTVVFDETTPSTDFSVVGLVNADTVDSITLTSTGAAATATVAGSPYDIVPSAAVGTGLGNYDISYVDGALTVDQKDASVTANDKSRVYGIPNPPLDATVTGTVNGDILNYTLATTATQFSLIGTYPITVTLGSNPNYNVTPTDGTLTITTAFCFSGFHSPIGGSVENGNGGTFADPVRAFKLGSTIPVKFTLYPVGCQGSPVIVGIHTLQAIKYSSSVDSDPAIDATPTDAATTGNQFRLTDSQWHFNLSTKNLTTGTWLLRATLQDGSTYSVWISIKK